MPANFLTENKPKWKTKRILKVDRHGGSFLSRSRALSAVIVLSQLPFLPPLTHAADQTPLYLFLSELKERAAS